MSKEKDTGRTVWGTHNSATGMPTARALVPLLAVPFSRCQRRTLAAQWAAGCRRFDIRVRARAGRMAFAHGLWRSDADVEAALSHLSALAGGDRRAPTVVAVAYEGDARDFGEERLIRWVSETAAACPHLTFTQALTKLPQWRELARLAPEPEGLPQAVERYDKLTLRPFRWRALLPVPLLWAWLRRAAGGWKAAGGMAVVDGL